MTQAIGGFPPVQPAGQPGSNNRTAPAAQGARGPAFDQILARQLAHDRKVRFSAHAEARLRRSNIQLGAAQFERLEAAVERAAAKGARDALILLGDLALVVSIANRTVITAVDEARSRDNVFTNIDSAVIT